MKAIRTNNYTSTSLLALLLATALLLPIPLIAGPSAAQMQADLKREFPSATEVRIRPNASGERQISAARWEFQQMVEIVTPTNAFPSVPNAKAVRYGGAIYYSSNRSTWTFDRFNIGETTYEGIPTPSHEELIAYFESQKYDDFFQYESYIIGMPELQERDRGCLWHSVTRMVCRFDTTIYMKRGNSVAKMPRTVTVTLWKDEGATEFNKYATSWDDNGRAERLEFTPEMEEQGMLSDILEAL